MLVVLSYILVYFFEGAQLRLVQILLLLLIIRADKWLVKVEKEVVARGGLLRVLLARLLLLDLICGSGGLGATSP